MKKQKIQQMSDSDRKFLLICNSIKLIYLVVIGIVLSIQYFIFKVNIGLLEFLILFGITFLINPVANLIIKIKNKGKESASFN